MIDKKLFDKGLPKWPGLLVTGNNVTKEQAKEILIRTDGFWMSTNDREFEKMLTKEVYGIESSGWNLTEDIQKAKGLDWNGAWAWKEEVHAKLNLLELSYLNNSRIVSCWIGGPHGWCDWEGNIEACNYNIGKWPSIQEVYDDWVKIAEAFPYLELKSQLLDGEIYNDGLQPTPIVEFKISGGKVDMYENSEILMDPEDIDFTGRFGDPHAERGCTFEQFKDALDFVRKKFGN